MKRTLVLAFALLGAALLLAAGNRPALGKDIFLQGMIHNQLNILDGDTDEIVGTVTTRGRKVTNFTWDPRDLDKVYTITDWGQQIEQLDLSARKVVRTFRVGSGDVKARALDIEINPAEPDLLSIDIDRNDWHVWKAITKYRPRVVIVEYNPLYPPGVQFVVPYDGKAVWDGTSRFGASLKSYELLGAEKGYRLAGCVLAGVNAFFVRNDAEGGKFASPYTSENHWEPARYGLNGWDRNHPRNP